MNTLSITVPVMVFGLFLYLRLYKRMNLENENLRGELQDVKYVLEQRALPATQETMVLRSKVDHLVEWFGLHVKEHHAQPLDPAAAAQAGRDARERQRQIEEALGG